MDGCSAHIEVDRRGLDQRRACFVDDCDLQRVLAVIRTCGALPVCGSYLQCRRPVALRQQVPVQSDPDGVPRRGPQRGQVVTRTANSPVFE